MGARSFGETGSNGPLQLITALRDPQVDAVVVSFGTNDLRIPGKTPEEIVGHFRELRSWTRRAGRSFFVATTPPYVGPEEIRFDDRNPPPCGTGTCFNQRINRLNKLVWASFPPSEVIEFHRNYPRERFAEDGIHVDAEGQALRGKRAAYVLHGTVCCDAKRQCRPPRICMDSTESEALERVTGKKFDDLRGMIPAGTCVDRERLREAAEIGSELSQAEWKIRVDTEVQKRSVNKEFECRESDECREVGKCASVAIPGSPGEFDCRPTWKEHCEESAACRDQGACRLEDNLCVR